MENPMNDENINELVRIIHDYRRNELSFIIGPQHVRRWLAQFQENTQEIILYETTQILKSWFLSERSFIQFYDAVLKYLTKKYSLDEQELLRKVVFIDTQGSSHSQSIMLKQLNDLIIDRYGFDIQKKATPTTMAYVYLDDGLFTGVKARKELKEVISTLPKGASLDVFYLLGATQGMDYSTEQLRPFAQGQRIDLQFFQMKPIYNHKKASIEYHDGAWTKSYYSEHSCLWPERSVESAAEIKEYIDSNIRPYLKSDTYLFRYGHWTNDCGIFSSIDNRRIVELEFLKKGIEIANHCRDNGLYPLGFNSWHSLGFGSICATYMNIPNTCPLVLWWGNNVKQGNILDFWYPLLPRRTNTAEELQDFEESENEIYTFQSSTNQHNMCPDCGRFFGIENDGGNGFCLDCAWKH